VSAEAKELVNHSQPSAQENACQEILGQYEPNVGVYHLAGTPHLAEDATVLKAATKQRSGDSDGAH
jgi:hypothetical protein